MVINKPKRSHLLKKNTNNNRIINTILLFFKQLKLPVPVAFNEITREKAKKAVRCMESSGSTNMSEALLVSLYLVKLGQDKYQNHQPIIVFLTDGYPTMGIINLEEIISMVSNLIT